MATRPDDMRPAPRPSNFKWSTTVLEGPIPVAASITDLTLPARAPAFCEFVWLVTYLYHGGSGGGVPGARVGARRHDQVQPDGWLGDDQSASSLGTLDQE